MQLQPKQGLQAAQPAPTPPQEPEGCVEGCRNSRRRLVVPGPASTCHKCGTRSVLPPIPFKKRRSVFVAHRCHLPQAASRAHRGIGRGSEGLTGSAVWPSMALQGFDCSNGFFHRDPQGIQAPFSDLFLENRKHHFSEMTIWRANCLGGGWLSQSNRKDMSPISVTQKKLYLERSWARKIVALRETRWFLLPKMAKLNLTSWIWRFSKGLL